MVAMLGAIMPQPLAIPPMVKVDPRDHHLLGPVVGGEDAARGVVGAVDATASSPSLGVAARIGSIGSGVPMISVEHTITWEFGDLKRFSNGRSHQLGILVAGLAPSRHWHCPN